MSRKATTQPDEIAQKQGQKRSFSQIAQAILPPHKNLPNCRLLYLYCSAKIRETLRKSAPILNKNLFATKLINKAGNIPQTHQIQPSRMTKKGLALAKMSKMMYSVLC